MSLNRVILMGRITRDLEKKTTPSGVSILNFTLAVEDDYKPRDGSDRKCNFVDCVAWRGTADFLEKYSGKGRNIVVVGSLQSEKWQDRDGNNRVSWKVQVDNAYFADSKPDGAASARTATPSPDISATGFTDEGTEGGDLPF